MTRNGPGLRGAVVLAAAAAVLLATGSTAPGSGAEPPKLKHVTVFADSVATAIALDSRARITLGEGVDVDLQLTPCRRLVSASCPYMGERPPTVYELAQRLGSGIGDTVIVAVGYNDFEDQYADEIETVLQALRADGVQRVVWPTLRASRHSYLTMNDAIQAASQRHPELTVVDWNVYSRSHPEWFQDDGLHLFGQGPEAMATLFHQALVDLGVAILPAKPAPPPPTTGTTTAVRVATPKLPDARTGKRYSVTLAAQGGQPPYRWTYLTKLPTGLHLTIGGKLSGVVEAAPGSFVVAVRVADASRTWSTVQLPLRVRP